MDVFAQLWKEYALSDSRYLTSNTFVLAAEGLTVILLAPLSYLMVYLIIKSSPYRTPVQIMVCFGHMYSDTLYYATSWLDFYMHGVSHCRPEAYYYWVYYVAMNGVWMVVPAGKPEISPCLGKPWTDLGSIAASSGHAVCSGVRCVRSYIKVNAN
jgi:cholestenol Delta-isomerase